MVRVKVCGLTNMEDALFTQKAGVDFLGFVVDVPVETPRKITLSKAAGIMREIERKKAIIVVMPSALKEVERVLELKPYGMQFHGRESVEFMQAVKNIAGKTKLIKTLHVSQTAEFEEVKAEAGKYPMADYLLLDTLSDKVGGTGMTHDWTIAGRLSETAGKPVFLSGGLKPENVCNAIKKANPYAVDVSSGVELQPGIKDKNKIIKLLDEVKKCST
ncbi:MAG: phosphoribosylanthranilate isomerase [Candidatus Altiarchaeales archaeon]|nr:phosphoribosylanthranilate isomerase [Candidatus Altiarchaeales archaeon]